MYYILLPYLLYSVYLFLTIAFSLSCFCFLKMAIFLGNLNAFNANFFFCFTPSLLGFFSVKPNLSISLRPNWNGA